MDICLRKSYTPFFLQPSEYIFSLEIRFSLLSKVPTEKRTK